MKILTVPLLAAGLMVAQVSSCQQQTSIILQDVDNIAQAVCHFVPSLATVQAIVGANPALTTASAVAAAICALVPPAPATAKEGGVADKSDRDVATVDYNGKQVVINGHWDFQPVKLHHDSK